MSQNDDVDVAKTASEKLAELVERRNADLGARRHAGFGGQRQNERFAAARSLSRSKPAARK
jgi:hypothetical protein